MSGIYSRKRTLEEKRNFHKALLFVFTAMVIIVLSVVTGFNLLANLFNFLGAMKTKTSPAEITDFIPPRPPQLLIPVEATNSGLLTVTGISEQDSTVYLRVNDKEMGSNKTNRDGYFTFQNVVLKLGSNSLSAIAEDEAGNRSQISHSVKIQYSTALPKLEITSPADRQVFTGKNSRVAITGKTHPDCRVTINDRIAIVGSDGGFEITFGLAPGENIFVIAVVDPAGNSERKEISVTYRP